MQNVLFNTDEPDKAEGRAEFYIVSLTLRELDQKISFVEEKHGWWDKNAGRVTLDQASSSPPEMFTSFSDAIDRYCELRMNRARAGFVHSFSWNGFVGSPSNYKRIDTSD